MLFFIRGERRTTITTSHIEKRYYQKDEGLFCLVGWGVGCWWSGGSWQPRDERCCIIISLALMTAEVEPAV